MAHPPDPLRDEIFGGSCVHFKDRLIRFVRELKFPIHRCHNENIFLVVLKKNRQKNKNCNVKVAYTKS